MATQLFKYTFTELAPMPDEETFVLALLAMEGLHGEAATRLLVEHAMDFARCTCIVDASTDLGFDLSRVFTGYLQYQFGPDSFRVERVDLETFSTSASTDTGGV